MLSMARVSLSEVFDCRGLQGLGSAVAHSCIEISDLSDHHIHLNVVVFHTHTRMMVEAYICLVQAEMRL